ncbi:peptide ABC transporter substrate-binding protein [Tenuifilaceae bacterium CYCD]|nr:peptide ABC transporter substrate-binding protein [Tenuifilaceae bacterium CYCD]
MKLRILFYLALIVTLVGCQGSKNQVADRLVFRYNESKGVTTLDPAYARNLSLIWPINQLYNGLVQLSDSLSVQPCIASRWSISEDGLEYTFYLRGDVYFHDSKAFPNMKGRKVVAGDFVYTFNRIIDPITASPGAWVLSMLDKDYKGSVNGCLAPSDSVFIVHLKKPFPAFLGLMSMPYCFVVPHEAVEMYGNDFGRNPVGTGPFYMKFWKEGEKLILRKNSSYFEKDANGDQLPYLESVAITFIADKQSEFLEFVAGNIDFLSGVHAASKDELLTRTGDLNPKYKGKVKMITGPYLNTEYLGILLDSSKNAAKNSPLLNSKVRKAIGYGFDRNAMSLYLRSNMVYPAIHGIVPPGMPGFGDVTKGFNYNPDLARKLLAEGGFPNGEGLPEVVISTTDDYMDICEFIQHQLGEIGIKIRIEVLPGAAYREMMANSKLPVFRASWVADYADPENYLALFLSGNFSPQGPNYTHFTNSNFDKLYNNALLKPEYSSRIINYREMDSLVISNAAVIPLYYDKVVRFVSNGVEGMTVNPMNLLVLKRVRKNGL